MTTITHPAWHLAVLIPARNEEHLLSRCLESVLVARSRILHEATCDIVVAVDSSSDRTLEIAQQLPDVMVASTDAGIVGRTRAIAASLALKCFRGPLDRCWLANTDADCIVPPHWLAGHLHLARQGFEAAAGSIDVDKFTEHGREVESRFRNSYLIQPDGSHPHVHGANLGVRADAYVRAGGWGDLATAEDHDFWTRLAGIGSRRTSTSDIRILTSGRRVGRAPHGFAEALAFHNESAA